MNQDQPLVSIVVLNWNGLEDTRECLKSLRKLDYKNVEIILVDNGSEDGSKEVFAKEKGIVFLDLDKNYGFTGGHIRGLEAAKGRYVAIFNNDLAVDKHWISAALATMRRHSKAAVVGGKSYKWNDKNPAYNTGNDFTAFQEVDPRTGYTRTLLTGNEERQVDAISGSALLFDTKALQKVGYLDDDFFAYYEETDLIARLFRAGYEAYFTPEAMTWHKVAGSSEGGEESYFYLYMMHRNRYMFGVKNLDGPYLKPFMRNYFDEALRAFFSGLFKPTQEKRARVNAYLWNRRHKQATLAKRRKVLQLGDSYVRHLGAHKPTDVTVVIPCYNYGQYLNEAIDSVLAQTLQPAKIIVINDGSTDDTKARLKKYEKNKLFEIIHKENGGVISAKNLGLSKSQTYWTLFFDADDVLMPDFLEKTVGRALDTGSDVIYTDMELFGPSEFAIFHAGAFSLPRLIRKNFIHNSSLMSTSMLKQVGGYKPIMKDGLEDWELYLSLAEQGARFGYVPEVIFRYRQHASSKSRNGAVLQKEKELYRLIVSLHPRLRRYSSRPRRWAITFFKGIAVLVVHPSLWIVLVKSLPKAALAFAGTIVHELRTQKSKLTDVDYEEK